MHRAFVTAIASLVFALAAAPAFAQSLDQPTEPVPPNSEPDAGSIEVTKTGLAVGGRSVIAAIVGVEVSMTLTLHNGGPQAIKNVNVTLADPPDGVRLVDAEADVGDLARGASADAEFAFVIEGECFDFVGFGGEATYDGGAAPLKVGIPAACPGPRLSLSNVIFDGGDGDDIPEPGETLRVTFELVNNGRDAVTNLRASVKISGDGIRAIGTELAWPDIDPGGSARNVAPLILSIASDAPRQESCAPLPRDVPVSDEPARDDGSLPPDSVVSSDGTVSSPANTGDPSASGGSEPGSPGSSGGGSTAEEPPTTVEPLPATVEPEPGTGSTEPGAIEPEPLPPEQPIEPAPLPEPVEPAPNPEPAEGSGVAVRALLTVTAAGYETATEWSNQTICLLKQGIPADAASVSRSSDESASTNDGAALPVIVALGVSMAAAIVHRRFVP